MAYGTARMRAFYGAGDYSTALALNQYRGGYYPAGGWLSGLAKRVSGIAAPLIAKAAPLAKVAAPVLSGIGGKVMRALPGIGTAVAVYDIAKAGVDAFRTGVAPAHTVTAGPGGLGVSFAGGGTPMEKAQAVGAAAHHIGRGVRHVRAAVKRHRVRRALRRARRHARRHAGAGDAGRNRHGRFMRGHHFTRRRRRHHGHGGHRISFRTKDGRTVSFTRKHRLPANAWSERP